MSRCSTNKEAWEKIFEKYNILEEIKNKGYFKISSKEINEFREARLMTKFDNSESIPEILKKNELSILPISSNSYMVAKFDAYKKFERIPKEVQKVEFLPYIESLDYNNITSETLALNCAYITKILEDFLGEEELVPTVSGKMGSGVFNFEIAQINSNKKMSINVENSRIEIDGGYEGTNSLALIEAKNVVAEDFLVRQLYYPYRLWKSKVTKLVRPIYIVYSNGIFTIFEYKFNKENEYSSIELVKCKKYSIEDTNIDLGTIQNLIDNIKNFDQEPTVSFPQANNFERVINLCEMLQNSEKEKQEITNNYEFVSRQTNYYTDAAIYLGLIKKSGTKIKKFEITNLGKQILKLNYKSRQIEFVKLILSHKVFHMTIKKYFEKSEMPSDDEIVNYMRECKLYNITSDITYYRRASTIKSWIYWIISLVTE